MRLRNADIEMLIAAVKMIAQRYQNVKFNKQVVDYYNKQHEVVFGFSADGVRGLGFIINEEGLVQVVGDDWGSQELKLKQFQKILSQVYTQQAAMKSLYQMGYTVTSEQIQNKLFVRGLQYA